MKAGTCYVLKSSCKGRGCCTGTMAPSPACSYPPSQDLVDSSALLQGALGNDFRPHFFHIQHESIQGLLDSGLLGFLLSLWFWLRFPWWDRKRSCQHQSHPPAQLPGGTKLSGRLDTKPTRRHERMGGACEPRFGCVPLPDAGRA